MTPDLAAIKRRAEAATGGPWEAWNGCSWWRIGRKYHQGERSVIEPTSDRSDGHPTLTGPNLRADLEFIAHARQDIPDLLTALSAAEAKVRELEAALERAWGMITRGGMRTYEHNELMAILSSVMTWDDLLARQRIAAAAMQKESEG